MIRLILLLFVLLGAVGCARHPGQPVSATATASASPTADPKELELKEKIFQASQQLTIHNNRASEAKSRGDSNTALGELNSSLAYIQQRDSTEMELGNYYQEKGRDGEAADLFRAVYKSCGESNPLGQQARDKLLSMHERLE